MKIPLSNGYVLRSDPMNFWITKLMQNENGKGKEYERVVSGYFRTIPELLADFSERRIGESEAESIKELAKDINKLKRLVKSWKGMLTLDYARQLDKGRSDADDGE